MGFHARVTDGNVFGRRREELDRGEFRQIGMCDVQNQPCSVAFPGSGKVGGGRARQLFLKLRKKLAVCRCIGRRDRKRQSHRAIARNADLLTDKPAHLGR